jgi:hypothetical protein
VRAADLSSYLTSAPQGPSFSTPSMSVKGRGGGAMSDLLLPGTAYVDLEVHLPFAQRLGVGDHPIPALQAGRFRASAISEVIQPSRSWCVTCPLMRAAEGPVRKAVALPPKSDSSPFKPRRVKAACCGRLLGNDSQRAVAAFERAGPRTAIQSTPAPHARIRDRHLTHHERTSFEAAADPRMPGCRHEPRNRRTPSQLLSHARGGSIPQLVRAHALRLSLCRIVALRQ